MLIHVSIALIQIKISSECFFFYNSNKDEELLKTYKNVYSKILRAEKTAPLLSRIELFLDLLQQLIPKTGSGDLGASS